VVGCSPCRVRGGVNTVHGGRRSRTRLSAHGINMDVTVIARVGAKRGRMQVAPWEALSAAKHPVWYWYCTVLVRSLRLGRWLASIAGTGMFGGWRHRTIPCIVGIRQPVGGRASVASSVATAADEGFDYHSVVLNERPGGSGLGGHHAAVGGHGGSCLESDVTAPVVTSLRPTGGAGHSGRCN
jgi:hypothetical protein